MNVEPPTHGSSGPGSILFERCIQLNGGSLALASVPEGGTAATPAQELPSRRLDPRPMSLTSFLGNQNASTACLQPVLQDRFDMSCRENVHAKEPFHTNPQRVHQHCGIAASCQFIEYS